MLALVVAAGCNTGPPDRDVFVPPYAEKGCWARLYEQAGFAGRMRELEGPVFAEALAGSPVLVPNIEDIPPQPLFSEVKSLQIGPHARFLGYAETLFRNPTLALPPGSAMEDLSLRERLQSFRMDCVA